MYLSEIIIKKNIQPYEVLYIGNSNNDEFAYKSGVRTLCVNPKYTSTSNKKVWHNCIPLMNNLTEIYPFIYGHSFI